MDTESRLTRAELLRRVAGAGAVVAVGGGYGVYRLLGDGAPTSSAAVPTVRGYTSRPDLRPPVVEVLHRAERTAPGYLFIAPSSGPGQRGVLLLDDTGRVVWFHPTTPLTAMNFRAAVYQGKPVLTWWEGKFANGYGDGQCVIVDQSYREVARFKGGNGRPADLHEFFLTSRDTALITSGEKRTMDLTNLGGKRAWPVQGGVVQELEVPSARVLFEWRSLDHVALAESHQKIGPTFDYFHINSIDVDADGNLLVSARNTWAVYKVDRGSGKVIWRLGGKRSDFAMGAGTVFAWQHDARSHNGSRMISIFDDGAAPKVEPQSRAIVLGLDTKRMRATLLRKYTHGLLAKHTGSTQLLPNGDVLVGWGSEPYFTEYAADGSVRFDARLPHGGQTYRALRFPWVGHPTEPPRLASVGGMLYASWNGATEVASWRLRAGTAKSRIADAQIVSRTAFETALSPPAGARYTAAVALDAAGKPLGTSGTIRI